MKTLMILALLACGAPAQNESDEGWCCDGICGLSAEAKSELTWGQCTCDGIVRADGECDEPNRSTNSE